MSKIILLGAGASVDAGISTANEMTKNMANHFEKSRLTEELNVIKFVVGGLLSYITITCTIVKNKTSYDYFVFL